MDGLITVAGKLFATVHAVARAHASARELYRDRFAPDFSPFQFILSDELTLSRLLTWLLDPRGTHGQGSRFLALLLKTLSKDWLQSDGDVAEVLPEFHTDQGRLDIRVRIGSRMLVIENKPWAGDQHGQLERYFGHLEEATDRCLIYLTPDGTCPACHSLRKDHAKKRIDAGELHLWSYRGKLLGWLEECRASCRAERVALFIGDFARELQRLFGGMHDVTEQEHFVDAITRTADDVLAAMTVVSAADAIRDRLLRRLRADLDEALAAHGWSLGWDMGDGKAGQPIKPHASISIFLNEHCPWVFSLEFELAGLRRLAFGIYGKNGKSDRDDLVREMLERALGPGKRYDTWPWYRDAAATDAILPVEPHWGSTPEPWQQIASRELPKTIVKAAKSVFDVIQRNGLA